MSNWKTQTTCVLPGGYVDASGGLHREAELLPLTGREEELLADRRGPVSAALVTSLLTRCVRRVGDVSPVSEEVARTLLVADRQYLLIKLREATFGDRVQTSLFCPWPACGKKVDIDFTVADIPVTESRDKGPAYTMELSPEAAFRDEAGLEHRHIIFRLPSGGDQEAISPILQENEAKALSVLLERCILRVGQRESITGELVGRLSPLARMEIERAMEAAAPKVELVMNAHCPECNRDFSAPFDIQDFFFGEMRTSRDLLFREVHCLAYHYHWSEREIMDMTRDKRRRYIDVLVDEIERQNNAV